MTDSHSNSTFLIRDLDTLRVIADPLRNQILEALIAGPQTVKQIADKLGLAPSKLYYHVNLLDKFNFIQVAETHRVANMIEKTYRASATDIEVDRSLLAFNTDEGKQAIQASILSVIETTREDLLRSLQARSFQLEQGIPEHPRRGVISRETSRIPEARLLEFLERLQTLLADFDQADSGQADADTSAPDAHPYALTILFYPSYYFEKLAKNSKG